MIGDVTDTFRNTTTTTTTTPSVDQDFVRKSQIETSAFHMVSYSKSRYVNHVFSGYAILLLNV